MKLFGQNGKLTKAVTCVMLSGFIATSFAANIVSAHPEPEPQPEPQYYEAVDWARRPQVDWPNVVRGVERWVNNANNGHTFCEKYLWCYQG